MQSLSCTWDDYAEVNINECQRLMINKLFDGFDGKLSSSKRAKLTKCSTYKALRALNDLIEKGVLVKEEAGGRSTNYVLK